MLSGAALWIGGIPDYMAMPPNNRGIEAQLEALLSPFGTVECVKGRYKVPGAVATRIEDWMGGSWGLVTFATKAACETVVAQGVQVPVNAAPPTKGAGSVQSGFLMVKKVDKQLVEQSPIGKIAAEQHVARMEAALARYKQLVRLLTLCALIPTFAPLRNWSACFPICSALSVSHPCCGLVNSSALSRLMHSRLAVSKRSSCCSQVDVQAGARVAQSWTRARCQAHRPRGDQFCTAFFSGLKWNDL